MSSCKEVVIAVGTYDSMVVCLTFDSQAPGQSVSHEYRQHACSVLLIIDQGLRGRFQCRAHSGSVKAVASSDRWLASGSSDETIKYIHTVM